MNCQENTTPDLISEIRQIIENNQDREWFRTTDLADYLNISLSQVHVLKNEGKIPFTKLAGTIFFKKEDIDRILEENMIESLQ